MELFDENSMSGRTKSDTIKLIEAVKEQLKLYVDENYRVITDKGIYVADAMIIGPGFGLLYEIERL